MNLNRGALKFCGVYTVFFVVLVGLGYLGDFKARIFMHGLAVFPVLAPLSWSGLLERIVPVDSWMNNVFFLFPFCVVIIYLIGWTLSGIGQLLRRLLARPPQVPIGDDPPGWHPP